MNNLQNNLELISMVKENLEKIFNFNNGEINKIEQWWKNLDEINKWRFENIIIRLWEIKEFTKDRFSNSLFLSLIFCVEGMINIFEKDSSRDKFKNFLNSNLDGEDKKGLILAFTFNQKHVCLCDAIKWQIDEDKNHGTNFGVMKDCLATDINRKDNFETLCRCKDYLNKGCSENKINEYFNKLLDHFYEMRNSEVHRGFPIKLDFRKDEKIQRPETSSSVSYATRDDELIIVSAVDINIYEFFLKAIKNKLKKN